MRISMVNEKNHFEHENCFVHQANVHLSSIDFFNKGGMMLHNHNMNSLGCLQYLVLKRYAVSELGGSMYMGCLYMARV